MLKNYKFLIATFLVIIICFFAGCGSSKLSNNSNGTISNSNTTISNNATIKFKCIYKGFSTVKQDEAASFPQGTLVILSDDVWHSFINKYLPGLPYDEEINFQKECAVYCASMPAKWNFGVGIDVHDLTIIDNELTNNNFEGDNGIHIQNIPGILHVYVNIVKVNKNDIQSNLKNIYKG